MLKDGDIILFGTDSEVRVQVSASPCHTLSFRPVAGAGCRSTLGLYVRVSSLVHC